MIARLLTNFINFFVVIVELFLGMRVVLKLFGADSTNNFAQWVYTSSDVLLDPFRGIFPVRELSAGSVIDFSALFAMLVYGLLGMVLIWVVVLLTPDEPVVVKKR